MNNTSNINNLNPAMQSLSLPDTSIEPKITNTDITVDITNKSISKRNTIENSVEFTPDEFIEKLQQNTLPDCNLIVRGDLALEDLAITHLPKKLQVTEQLTIKRCHNITNITEEIKVKSLTIANCNKFIGLANNTKITGILTIIECNNFVVLPENLRISELYLRDCRQIAKFDDITVFTVFSIDNCPSITKLPKQFSERGIPAVSIMSIKSCDNIIIPSGIRVLGNLTIANCNNIISLPEITICNLYIESCPKLQELPTKFHSTGDITIANCMNLTSFPSNWLKNTPFHSICHNIDCINTGISQDYADYFMSRYFYHNIIFTVETRKKPSSVKQLIKFWQKTAENTSSIKIDNITVAESYNLIEFFYELTKTNYYLAESTRQSLANKVITIFKNIGRNNWFKEEASKVIHSAISDTYNDSVHTDRVLVALGKLEFLPRIYNLIEDKLMLNDH